MELLTLTLRVVNACNMSSMWYSHLVVGADVVPFSSRQAMFPKVSILCAQKLMITVDARCKHSF